MKLLTYARGYDMIIKATFSPVLATVSRADEKEDAVSHLFKRILSFKNTLTMNAE